MSREGPFWEVMEGRKPALVATLGEGEWAPTTDLHVQFIAPAKPGKLTGRGRIVNKGRRVAHMAGELLGPDGELVATATATAAIRSARSRSTSTRTCGNNPYAGGGSAWSR